MTSLSPKVELVDVGGYKGNIIHFAKTLFENSFLLRGLLIFKQTLLRTFQKGDGPDLD